MSNRGVFVFAEDGVQFFATAAEAAAYVEAVDVETGVYEAFISLDGERLLPRPVDETNVRLERSGQHDDANLKALLERDRATRHAFTSDPSDPVGVANELLAREWEARWPKWPHWLDRRLHGAGPARVEPT
ncbi:MAG: hypothetical protein M3P83_08370 [Actinomycetota bacterium]|nr:hypothetical protein [Actinomycetota bacterium]